MLVVREVEWKNWIWPASSLLLEVYVAYIMHM